MGFQLFNYYAVYIIIVARFMGAVKRSGILSPLYLATTGCVCMREVQQYFTGSSIIANDNKNPGTGNHSTRPNKAIYTHDALYREVFVTGQLCK